MSQIAQALAKAKERTGLTTAPFGVPGQLVKPIVPPTKVKNNQRTWVVLLSIVIVCGGLFLWYSGRFSLDSSGSDSDPGTGDPSVANGTGAGTGGTTAPIIRVGDPVVRAEVQDAINSLVISAVMPGKQPRIMLQGRVVGIGQPVDNNVVFSGIKSDRLVFTDASGAVYTRRY